MNRIIKKISAITILIAFCAFTAFAAIETVTFSKVLKKAADDKLFFETKKFANQISMVFENAEGSVDTLCAEVSNSFDISEQLRDSSYIKEYMKLYSPVIKDALTDIEDSQGLYITFSPDITDRQGTYEIWYSYDKDGRLTYTDAMSNGIYYESFDDEEFPTMQYYFSAVESPGEGIWTEPYVDSDINEEVIAYSRAVYCENMLIGVIGTDIYTEYTIDLISDMRVENDGMVFLLDGENNEIISSDNIREAGFLDSHDLWETLTAGMEGKKDGFFGVDWNGKAMRISFSELSNEWKLAIINYEDKLYSAYDNIIIIVISLSAILVLLLSAAIYFTVRYFSSPVDRAIKMLHMMDLDNQVEEREATGIKEESDIELIVRKAMKRQRMNDIMLANQARLASVGEMMANVTHQWKQPLNNINIVMGNLKDDIENGQISEEEALLAISKVERLTTGMSDTLTDFSDYLKPDMKLVAFNVNHVIEAVLDLFKDKIKTRNIQVNVKGEEGLMSYGYKNSLYHVILNIVDNAIDAIDERGSEGGIIDIAIRRETGKCGRISVEIFNNGVQLSESERENLFRPYYTTKGSSDGTGLGLAISKHFIEESMAGEISLENYKDGVRCVILINEKEERHDR